MTDHTRRPGDNLANGSSGERDDIAVLLRTAGKRDAVPRDRFDRAREAARSEWRRSVKRRSRVRTVWTVAAMAAAAVLALALVGRFVPFGSDGAMTSAATARVAAITGSGWVSDGGARHDLVVDEAINLGSPNAPAEAPTIGTDADGRVALVLASGHAVRLDRGTQVRMLDPTSIALDRGSVYIDSGFGSVAGADPSTAVAVHTPLGIVREIGTQFEVRLQDGALRVRLREGAAVVNHDGQTHDVTAGGELQVRADGSVTRGDIASHDADWDWLLDVTPTPPLDGRTARNFLEWVVRERGWTLAFADETVARSADTIVLGGAGYNLTVEEALDAVLPTCRLDYRVEDGVLFVSAD